MNSMLIIAVMLMSQNDAFTFPVPPFRATAPELPADDASCSKLESYRKSLEEFNVANEAWRVAWEDWRGQLEAFRLNSIEEIRGAAEDSRRKAEQDRASGRLGSADYHGRLADYREAIARYRSSVSQDYHALLSTKYDEAITNVRSNQEIYAARMKSYKRLVRVSCIVG